MEASYSDEEKWMVVKGRRWRKTDPELSPAMVEELKHHLGVARNGVRAAKRSGSDDDLKDARGRVDAAKHGLGEAVTTGGR